MTEKTTYKINKTLPSLDWKESLLLFLIAEIFILTGQDDYLGIFMIIGGIFVAIYGIYLKKQIIGNVIISSDGFNVLLNNKTFFITHSSIDKLYYYKQFGYYYKNNEDSFEIRNNQAKIKKIKKTIE